MSRGRRDDRLIDAPLAPGVNPGHSNGVTGMPPLDSKKQQWILGNGAAQGRCQYGPGGNDDFHVRDVMGWDEIATLPLSETRFHGMRHQHVDVGAAVFCLGPDADGIRHRILQR